MTAVCPSESSPEGAQAADSRGSGATSAAASASPSAPEAVDSHGDSVQASAGGGAVIAGVQMIQRWSHQDSSDINTDDEGTSVRRLTPLERLNLDMCQDERYEGASRVVRELTVGRRIGFYKIRGEIGCGNFSHVKLGIHALTKDKVAINLLHKSKLAQNTRRHHSRDIYNMPNLNHPKIFRIYKVG
ncbi:unnamed protein product, partial [Tetraodon nigroviridis]